MTDRQKILAKHLVRITGGEHSEWRILYLAWPYVRYIYRRSLQAA